MKKTFEKKLKDGFNIEISYNFFLKSSYEPYCNINLILKPNGKYFTLADKGIFFDLPKIQIFISYKKIICFRYEKSII